MTGVPDALNSIDETTISDKVAKLRTETAALKTAGYRNGADALVIPGKPPRLRQVPPSKCTS